jgi:hypothetical protein
MPPPRAKSAYPSSRKLKTEHTSRMVALTPRNKSVWRHNQNEVLELKGWETPPFESNDGEYYSRVHTTF